MAVLLNNCKVLYIHKNRAVFFNCNMVQNPMHITIKNQYDSARCYMLINITLFRCFNLNFNSSQAKSAVSALGSAESALDFAVVRCVNKGNLGFNSSL